MFIVVFECLKKCPGSFYATKKGAQFLDPADVVCQFTESAMFTFHKYPDKKDIPVAVLKDEKFIKEGLYIKLGAIGHR